MKHGQTYRKHGTENPQYPVKVLVHAGFASCTQAAWQLMRQEMCPLSLCHKKCSKKLNLNFPRERSEAHCIQIRLHNTHGPIYTLMQPAQSRRCSTGSMGAPYFDAFAQNSEQASYPEHHKGAAQLSVTIPFAPILGLLIRWRHHDQVSLSLCPDLPVLLILYLPPLSLAPARGVIPHERTAVLLASLGCLDQQYDGQRIYIQQFGTCCTVCTKSPMTLEGQVLLLS